LSQRYLDERLILQARSGGYYADDGVPGHRAYNGAVLKAAAVDGIENVARPGAQGLRQMLGLITDEDQFLTIDVF
jgi:hypothetical protein